jgi:DNA repair protein RAD50
VSALYFECSPLLSNDWNIRYVRDKRSKRLQDCASAISQYETKIQEHGLEIEQIRKTVAKLDKEINEGGAALANLRENRRLRKLQSSIQATQKEIDSCDIEGASKAKRNFEEKYQPEKDRENEVQQRVAIQDCRHVLSDHPLRVLTSGES